MKEGRKEGRREGRNEGRKEGKEGMKEGSKKGSRAYVTLRQVQGYVKGMECTRNKDCETKSTIALVLHTLG